MPSLAMLRIPRPSDSKEFEELCKDYLKYRYNAEVQSYGRLGQDQKGIDIIVTLKDNSVICAQCKDVNKATVRDLDEWILEAEEFGYPMREFVIMVAVNNDTKLQDHILEVNKLRTQNRKAPVKLVFWDDVVEFIKKDPKIFSSYFPDLFSAMNEEHHWDDTKRIRKFSEKELKQENIRKFLSGRNSGRKYWELITSNQIVRREIVDTLLNKIDSPGIYVLTGAGGEGKTTALMQLGSELIKKGESVFFCNGYKPLPLPDPSLINKGSFFLLDNALGVASFLQLLEKMQELIDDKDASFILVARENEWNLMENDTPEYRTYYSGYVKKIPMGHVTKDESYLFAKCIKANLHISKDENQIQKIFQENSYGFLYASMLLSVSEKNTLDEVASDIINNLEQKSFDSLLILAFTVMSEHYNAKVNKALFKKLCAKYNRNERRVCSSLSKELVENAGIFQTRHPVISELFYQEILGHLLQVELDGVIENLVLLRLELSKKLSGALRWSYWTGIKAVMGSISLAGIDSQAHILQRLLDEIKEDVPYDFDSLFDLLESRESQSIFIKICYERDRLSPRNLRKWALQDLTEQPWDYSIPYSAAWLYRGIYDRLSADNMLDGYFWLNWAAFEKQYRGLGKYDQENSARWIYREACVNQKSPFYTLWLDWGRLEAENENVGDYNQENSARWIFREACINHNRWGISLWIAWGRLEAENGNLGDYDQENSARWIYREACVNRGVLGHTIWQEWGRLEAEEGHIGGYNQENSARWILRKACMEHNLIDGSIWSAWGKLEEGEGDIGKYDENNEAKPENSARWIYREACVNRNVLDHVVWKEWERLEAENGHIGDYNQENSARWILHKACMEHNLIDGSIWSTWGKLEEEEGNIGKYDENNEAKPENSARWIYREACVNRSVLAHIVWKEWGRLEEENGNIGDYNQENSARWILSTGIHNNPKDRYNLTVALAIMELKNGFVENARRVLEMNYLNNGSINGLLTILTIICGNGEKGPLLDDLIIELKNPKRSAMGYLYYCYLLQGDATSAESVLEALRIQSINPLLSEKFRNQVNTFITLCRLANESKPITDEENINAFFIDEEIEI